MKSSLPSPGSLVALTFGSFFLLLAIQVQAQDNTEGNESEGGREVTAYGFDTSNGEPTDLPVAGYSSGSFFIQSKDGAFRISPGGRLQFDAYAHAPAFDAPGQPRASFFLRRLRPELTGSLFHGKVRFVIAGEFADPPNGIPAADAFLLFTIKPWLKIQAGQFDLPFSFENRTSDRYIEFMERSFVVRNLGTANKEPGVMLSGALDNNLFYYSVGAFNGTGFNIRNLDNAFDVVSRVFVRPFAKVSDAEHPGARPSALRSLRRWQLGGSFQWGRRRLTNEAYLGGAGPVEGGFLITQSGYSFFPSIFEGADGNGTQIGLVPEGNAYRAGGEISIPMGPLRFRSEYIYVRSEVDENILEQGVPLRAGGLLEGHGAYALLSYWPMGDPDILPEGGVEGAAFFDATGSTPEDRFHLELALRGEYAYLDYDAGAEQGTSNLGGSQADGTYKYWGLTVGSNLWWSRHIRFTVNYVLNHIEGERALLPATGQNFLHEIGGRIALAL